MHNSLNNMNVQWVTIQEKRRWPATPVCMWGRVSSRGCYSNREGAAVTIQHARKKFLWKNRKYQTLPLLSLAWYNTATTESMKNAQKTKLRVLQSVRANVSDTEDGDIYRERLSLLSRNMALTKLTLHQPQRTQPLCSDAAASLLACTAVFFSLWQEFGYADWAKNDSSHWEASQKVVDHHPVVLNGHCKPRTKEPTLHLALREYRTDVIHSQKRR